MSNATIRLGRVIEKVAGKGEIRKFSEPRKWFGRMTEDSETGEWKFQSFAVYFAWPEGKLNPIYSEHLSEAREAIGLAVAPLKIRKVKRQVVSA